MYKEIVINLEKSDIRIAVLEDHQLVEFLVFRAIKTQLLGNVYLGKVKAILPGMQAAFIDIGFEKNAFLHVSDIGFSAGDIDDLDLTEGDAQRNGKDRYEPKPIETLLKKGQEILVQVIKEPINTKGPRVSTNISLPGRHVVMMPTTNHLGVSKRIVDRIERERLRRIIRQYRKARFGFIARTEAEDKDEATIKEDMDNLTSLWEGVRGDIEGKKSPILILEEEDPLINFLRDSFNATVNWLIIDNKAYYDMIVTYLQRITPELVKHVRLYEDKIPIYDAYEIEDEITKLMERKIWLKSGGYIVIDSAEALTPIDVNTGKYTGKYNADETILKTNIEAAYEIGRQLRLRDLGGIIVIDFIDMENSEDKEKVLVALKEALKKDRSHTKTFEVSPLGLVEMTRKRVRPDLLTSFYYPCPFCEGTGHILRPESVCMKILRSLTRIDIYRTRESNIEIIANSPIIDYLNREGGLWLNDLRERSIHKIDLKVDAMLKASDYRILIDGIDATQEYI